ncbi:AraC family transcriptional regulator [Siccibacter turicensis]|uniref:AraC family transcriptional regulator n=1 Tax=Siccibacter turicensis TaxID=357233 RepID=UPI00101F3721|nr:AraC family transcriptional regulator [Siccibacter turicensis]
MIGKQTVNVILDWVEQNLEQRLSIEDVALKSGYSRRNIQSLFKKYVGLPLGSYIRQRKLCRAATLIRLTPMTMSDISLLLHFCSQQAFCKEFKKLFGCTPRQYRGRDYWDLTNLHPIWKLNAGALPKFSLISLKNKKVAGRKLFTSNIYRERDDEFVWRRTQLCRNLTQWNKDIICFSGFRASSHCTHVTFVELFSGFEVKNNLSGTLKILNCQGGLYAFFHYEGPWKIYETLPWRIYLEVLPSEGLVRMDGYDIEYFYFSGTKLNEGSDWVVCDIYIPVRHKSALSGNN